MTPNRTEKDVLQGALARLQGHWTKGGYKRRFKDRGECFCAVGAIVAEVVGPKNVRKDGYRMGSFEQEPLVFSAIGRLAACLPSPQRPCAWEGPYAKREAVVMYNDLGGIAEEDIIALYKCAIDKVDQAAGTA